MMAKPARPSTHARTRELARAGAARRAPASAIAVTAPNTEEPGKPRVKKGCETNGMCLSRAWPGASNETVLFPEDFHDAAAAMTTGWDLEPEMESAPAKATALDHLGADPSFDHCG